MRAGTHLDVRTLIAEADARRPLVVAVALKRVVFEPAAMKRLANRGLAGGFHAKRAGERASVDLPFFGSKLLI